MPTFIDSNIFLYVFGAAHPLQAGCARVLQDVAAGSLIATTSTEVVQEVMHVMRRKGREAQALQAARRLVQLFPDLLPVTSQDVLVACDLLERHPRLSTRDAVHAATMRNNGLSHIVTADEDFDGIPGLVRVAPG